MAVTIEPTGKKIGATTMGSTAGGTLAGAATVVLVWLLSAAGVEVPPEVAAAFTVLIGGVGTLVGGKLTPSNQTRTISEVVPVPQEAPAPDDVAVPDGTGEHRAAGGATMERWSTAVDTHEADPAEVTPVVTDTVVEVQ